MRVSCNLQRHRNEPTGALIIYSIRLAATRLTRTKSTPGGARGARVANRQETYQNGKTGKPESMSMSTINASKDAMWAGLLGDVPVSEVHLDSHRGHAPNISTFWLLRCSKLRDLVNDFITVVHSL